MSITTFYRLCIGLPVVIPAVLIVVVNLFALGDWVGWVGELVAFSLIFGGIPYIALAIWAMRWVGGRSENEIRRLMFRAPLLMIAAFVPTALLIGVLGGRLGPWSAMAFRGAVVIVVLGYCYVGVAVLLRFLLGSRLTENAGQAGNTA
jgi:hypothetical protein